MSTENKILLQIELDAAKAINEVIAVKDRIKKLKEEQALLNVTTEDGKKKYEAYQGQIKSLTKEQRSLENSIAQTGSAFEFEKGSIAANRAELSRLTAEYKNIGNPTKQQADNIKKLSERLKEQEKAIGQTNRNVGNYTDSINAAGLGNTKFGAALNQVQGGFSSLKNGIETAKTGFTSLKGAIAAMGIGLLLIAFTALVSIYEKGDEGATQLQGAFKGLGAVIDVLTGSAGRLFSIFKDIATGNFTGAIETTKNLADEMEKAAKEGYALAIAFDDLEDRQRDFSLASKIAEKDISRLLIAMKNRTLSEKESYALADQASALEKANFEQQKRFAEENIALVEKENNLALKAIGITDEQIKAANTREKRMQLVGKLAGENAQKEIDARIKVVELEKESGDLQERIENRKDGIREKFQAKREAEAAKRLAEIEKERALQAKVEAEREAAIAKQIQRTKELDAAENNLTNFRNQARLTNIKLALDNEELSVDQRLELIQRAADAELRIQEDLRAQKLELVGNPSDQLLIEEQFQQASIEIAKNAQDEKTRIVIDANQKYLDEKKKTADLEEQYEARKLQIASNAFGALAGLAKKGSEEFKVLATIQATIDTYAAANAAYKSAASIPYVGYVLGPIAAGTAIAAGLKNVREINKLKDGVIGLEGPGTATSDSIPAMLSRGESVMTAKETQMFRPQLEWMRAVSTNKFATGVIGVNDGGFSNRSISMPVFNDSKIDRLANAVLNMPAPVVYVEDINTGQNRTVKVEERANV